MHTLISKLIAGFGAFCFACQCALAGVDSAATIYVLSNGWHTSIGLPASDLHGSALGEIAAQFPRAACLVFGWGEEEYYRAPKVTSGMTLKAIFLANPAALHVIGVRGRIERFFNHSEILTVRVSRGGFENLARFLSAEFRRDQGNGHVLRLAPGYYADSWFYAARGKYYLPKTCNVWTARVLRAGGVRVNPTFALVADDLMWRVRPSGKHIQTLRRPVDAF
jgi:uncharacterized protein (TIGR02117 family)